MKKSFITFFIISGLITVSTAVTAQTEGFTVRGTVNLPDGYEAGICCHTDTMYSVEVAHGTIKNGQFTLHGRHMDQPQPGTLMTNNMKLVSAKGWPVDSIRWTYTDIFLSNGEITVDKNFTITGGQVQTDFNEWQKLKAAHTDKAVSAEEAFIASHPQSVISVWLANDMLKRGYNLTKEQVEQLERTITSVPQDSARMSEFKKRIAFAKKTTKGGNLVDLELEDINGNICHLTDIVPKNKYVLVDFWASWCGICIAAMPEIQCIAEQYKDKFAVIAVSIDTKREAWKAAMEKHPEPWPQYVTTKNGYQDLFHKYQVGNGVPYYIMITPDGKVLNSPSHPKAVKEILDKYN